MCCYSLVSAVVADAATPLACGRQLVCTDGHQFQVFVQLIAQYLPAAQFHVHCGFVSRRGADPGNIES